MCITVITQSMQKKAQFIYLEQFPLKDDNKAIDITRKDKRQSRHMKALSDIKLDFRAAERSQSFILSKAVPEPMR